MRKTYLGLFLVVAACTKHESDNILTAGIQAQMVVSANGSGQTEVTATLFVGEPIGLDFVELHGEDVLVAESEGVAKEMAETQILNIVSYSATFDGDAEGTEFSIQFLRSVDDGAPLSFVTLPAAFDITSPVPPAGASRAADLVIDWAPGGAGDQMTWRAEGDCVNTISGTVNGDPGTFTIAAGSLVKRDGDMVPDECGVTVRLERFRGGTVDPGYQDGTITGKQVRTFSFQSIP